VSEEDADLVSLAEVVIEAKKPEEVEGFSSLTEAIISERYWHDKTYPYLRDNIARIQGARRDGPSDGPRPGDGVGDVPYRRCTCSR
jgi:hypothetical protein